MHVLYFTQGTQLKIIEQINEQGFFNYNASREQYKRIFINREADIIKQLHNRFIRQVFLQIGY